MENQSSLVLRGFTVPQGSRDATAAEVHFLGLQHAGDYPLNTEVQQI